MPKEMRKCSFCGKEIEVDCYYSDYALCKCDNSGKAFIEFDACESCLNDIVKMVKDRIQ